MKKVKITVLRKMFNEDLAKEYGAAGLRPARCSAKDRCFMQTMPNPTDFATRLGKRFTNMYLRWPTAQRKNRSTTAIG